MKVCYVTHLPNLTGASQSLLDILSGWKGIDIEPIVLLGKHGPLEDELKNRGIPYRIIPYSSEIQEKKRGIVNIIKRVKNIAAVPRIRKFFKEEQIDLVHNNSMLVGVGMEAAYQTKIPYLCHIREFIWEDHRITMLHEDRQYFLLNHANKALAISDAVEKKFQPLAPSVSFSTLFDGIDVDKYVQNHQDIFENDRVEILLAGRIAPGKGQLEAIQAIEILEKRGFHQFHLKIVGSVGDSEYEAEIKKYVQEQEITQVEFLGFTDLGKLRAECDIALVCSSAEALGRVTIESMLAGCLVIGAAAGATMELIQHNKTGVFYESANAEDLANKILESYENRKESQRIAKDGQKYARETFDASGYNSRLLKIYQEILCR